MGSRLEKSMGQTGMCQAFLLPIAFSERVCYYFNEQMSASLSVSPDG